MGISSWDKGRGYGCPIDREEFLEKLASDPKLKLMRQSGAKWGGEILPVEKKSDAHASKAVKCLENSRTFN